VRDPLVEGLAEGEFGGQELVGIGGAKIEPRGRGCGDRVDGGPAGDLTDVQRGAGISVGQIQGFECEQGTGEDEDRIGRAGVNPGMAAGAGDGNAEAAAGKSAGYDGRGASAFESDGGGDVRSVRAAGEKMAHAAEVAFALFPDVGGEEDRNGGGEFGVPHGGGEAEQAGEAGGVVAGSGSEDPGVDLGGLSGSSRGKDGVEVGGEEDDLRGSRVGTLGRRTREFGEGVAGGVDVGVGEAELPETVEEPGGAGLFAEGWGRDAEKFELPLAELRLVQMQPVERAMHRGCGGEACDAELGGGGHSLSSRLGGRVFDGDEEEALGWGGGASGRAVAGCEQGRNRVRQEALRAGLDEGANEVADHVMEESVGRDAVDDQTVVDVPGGVGDGANWGRRRFFRGAGCEVGISSGEGGEVVGAENAAGRLAKSVERERPGTRPDVRGEGWLADCVTFKVRCSRFEGQTT